MTTEKETLDKLEKLDSAFNEGFKTSPVEDIPEQVDPLTSALFEAIDNIQLGIKGLEVSIGFLADRVNAVEDWVFFLLSQNPKFMTVFKYAESQSKEAKEKGIFPSFPRDIQAKPKMEDSVSTISLDNLKEKMIESVVGQKNEKEGEAK